ncbi:hypothetical protein [Rufibacter ruber]|uniref:hypothetical protein n=1 Tax=Rufibacter ruber TaxID=1783499 RepID=UPI0012904D00|nr:hypothetical protein [Rufibacter ruber]
MRPLKTAKPKSSFSSALPFRAVLAKNSPKTGTVNLDAPSPSEEETTKRVYPSEKMSSGYGSITLPVR